MRNKLTKEGKGKKRRTRDDIATFRLLTPSKLITASTADGEWLIVITHRDYL